MAIQLWSVQADNVVLMDQVELATGSCFESFCDALPQISKLVNVFMPIYTVMLSMIV